MAEFKSFCNLIGWHSSRSCNQMLQELGKTLYSAVRFVVITTAPTANYNYHYLSTEPFAWPSINFHTTKF